MKKEVEFDHLISSFVKSNGDIDCHLGTLVRAARFHGIALWAEQNNIPASHLEELSRAATLRVNLVMENPSLIPIPEGSTIETFNTRALMELAPQSVRDRLYREVQKNGWNDPQVQRKVVQHFVNADFVRSGLPEVDQSALRGGQVEPMHLEKVIETRIAHSSSKHGQPTETSNLGELITRTDIPSTLGPFEYAPNCEVRYPPKVTIALGELVEKHAQIFSRFVPGNTEGDEQAYQHCIRAADGSVTEPFFQVDIAGLSREFLVGANTISAEKVTKTLRDRIFEFEPSIAMYGLIGTLGGGESLGIRFKQQLDIIKAKHDMPIVLLAPTREKLEAMRETEFGKETNQILTPEEVNQISGFDDLWGPNEFRVHLEQNRERCNCLLYVRPSDPLFKLKDPKQKVQSPLLGNSNSRGIIRRSSITLNIDDPRWPIGDQRRIKDSKVALPLMGMGFRVDTMNDVIEPDKPGNITATDLFSEFMNSRGLSQLSSFRAKPMQGVFGGYGQKTMNFLDHSNITWLKEMLNLRGPYVIQPEIEPLVVTDKSTRETFAVMDRAFFSMVGGTPTFMGGIRILIPFASDEAQRGRLHGTKKMISASII